VRRIVNNELKVIKDRKDILASEETKVAENTTHKLLDLINDETTFYIVKVPNLSCLNFSLTSSKIAFTQ
jgi:hypothetical protein